MAFRLNARDTTESSAHILMSAAFCDTAYVEVRLMATKALGGLARSCGSEPALEALHALLLRVRDPSVKNAAELELDRFINISNTDGLYVHAMNENYPAVSMHSVSAIGLRAKVLEEEEAFLALKYISLEGARETSAAASRILRQLQRI